MEMVFLDRLEEVAARVRRDNVFAAIGYLKVATTTSNVRPPHHSTQGWQV
jgi:hypothetical protein